MKRPSSGWSQYARSGRSERTEIRLFLPWELSEAFLRARQQACNRAARWEYILPETD